MLAAGKVSAYDNIYDGAYGRPSYFTSFVSPNHVNNMTYAVVVNTPEGQPIHNYEVAVYDQDNELRSVARSYVVNVGSEFCLLSIGGTEGDTFRFEVLYDDIVRPTVKKISGTFQFATNAMVGFDTPLVLTIDESGKPAEVAYTLSKVPAGAFRTVCLPYEVDCHNGTAYEIGALVPGEGLTLLPVETMEAGKPYFVKATAQGDIDFWYHRLAAGATTRVREPVPNNGLVGTLVDNGNVPEGMYILSSNQLYLVNSALPFKANRAYVDLSQIASHDSNVKGLKIPFVDAVEDAIGKLTPDRHAKAAFSLDGKQASAPLGGAYIVRMSDGTVRKVLKR